MFQTQQETAEWMGYPSIESMNEEHDSLHKKLCDFIGIESYSLKIANGEVLSGSEKELADHEENAVLWLQRFIQHLRLVNKI